MPKKKEVKGYCAHCNKLLVGQEKCLDCPKMFYYSGLGWYEGYVEKAPDHWVSVFVLGDYWRKLQRTLGLPLDENDKYPTRMAPFFDDPRLWLSKIDGCNVYTR